MPCSSDLFIQEAEKFIQTIQPHKILDIGAGAAKYADMIHRVCPDAYIEGLEPDASYIPRFSLQEKYNLIHLMTATEYVEKLWGTTTTYDLLIFGDVLEHMRKSEGKDILEFFCYRTKYMLILYPDHYIQYNFENGHPLENHVSIWSEDDFKNFDYTITHKPPIHMVTIRGYLPST